MTTIDQLVDIAAILAQEAISQGCLPEHLTNNWDFGFYDGEYIENSLGREPTADELLVIKTTFKKVVDKIG